MNLILLGHRCAGKSSVAREIARRVPLRRIETDDEVARLAGISIPEIFQRDGEAGFRRLEARVVGRIARLDGCIIALGGGTILDPVNRRALRRNGFLVLLDAAIGELIHRSTLPGAPPRPSLTGLAWDDEMRRLHAARLPIYRSAADHSVETTGRSVEEVARAVLAAAPGRIGSKEVLHVARGRSGAGVRRRR